MLPSSWERLLYEILCACRIPGQNVGLAHESGPVVTEEMIELDLGGARGARGEHCERRDRHGLNAVRRRDHWLTSGHTPQ
jgi:hypothetical protein